MGEPKKLASHIKEDKKKVAVNLANGGGIGVGIIFIGGALATAALVSAVTVGRRILKSSNSKKRDHCPSTGSTETSEKLIVENISTNIDESKGLLYTPDPLSNGAAKTSLTETDSNDISSKSFFQEENHDREPHSGKGDLICDDKEILSSSGLHGSESSRQYDGSFVKTEHFLMPVVEDQALFQPANMKEEPYGGEIEIIEEENIIEIPDVDQSTEVDNNDQKVREVKGKEAADRTEADHSAPIILQSSDEQESTLIDHDQDSSSMGCLPSKSSVPVAQDFFVQILYNSSLCKDEKLEIKCEGGSQAFEAVETLEGAEAVKEGHVDKSQSTMVLMTEEKEKKCDQHEVWLIGETAEQLKRDETLEVAHEDQDKVNGAILMIEEEEKNICSQHGGSLILQTVVVLKRNEKLDAGQADEGNSAFLIVPTVEVLKRGDKLDADQADRGYSNTVIMSGEEEEKFAKHDGFLTVGNAQGSEEDKALEAAQGKDNPETLMLGKEIGAPHDHGSDAAGEATKLADAVDSVSSSDLQKQPTEEQENPPIGSQEDNCVVPDGMTSEKVTCEGYVAQEPNLSFEAQGVPSQCQRGSGSESNLKEIELSIEASEMKEENVSSEPASEEFEHRAVECDINPIKQSIGNTLEETEDTPGTREADNVDVIGQMEISEEDSISDDTDEVNTTDKVEENSEGTGDSSVEYNTEPIWPAESLEELSMDVTELKLDDQKEKQQAEESKALQTGEKMYLNNVEDRDITVESLQNINEGKDNSKLTFLDKYMLDLAEQNDQQSNSLKPRIQEPTWVFMVLLWPLCFWSFGLPFLKISLIVVLVILLSKIQGT